MHRFVSITCVVLCFCFFIATCSSVFAQKRGKGRIDSLLAALSQPGNDTVKVKLLSGLSDQYSAINPDSGIIAGNSALELARKLNWEYGIAEAYYFLGFNYYNKSNYPKSLECLLQSLTINESIKNEIGIANTARKIGNIYRDLNQYTLALSHYSRATKLFEKNKDKLGTSRCYSNIGELYGFMFRYEEALRYHFAALALEQQIAYRNGMVITYYRIGSIYLYTKEFQKALSYHLAALQIVEKYASEITAEQIEEAYGGVAICYLEMAKHTPDVTEHNLYLKTTADYLSRAITGAEAIGQRIDLAIYYKALAETRSLQGDYSAAYNHLLDYTVLHDSLFSAKNNLIIANLESERERVLKEKLNRLQNVRKRNERLMFITGILTLIVVIGMILRNYRKQQASNKLLAAEKGKSEELLLNILPGEIAEELKNNGATTARDYEDVTVFFTDFVNFTRTGERMGTQKLVEELHTCFKAFDEIISKYNIEKIKTIGDAYLAVSGLPVPDNKHAENVMNATMEIKAFMLNRRLQLGEDTFEVRIGVHSGPVIAGIVGVKKFAYDIWGDTVNTAARMEQKSEAGKINISQTTYDLVKDKFTCIYRGEIEAKNKGMMKMYFVEGATT